MVSGTVPATTKPARVARAGKSTAAKSPRVRLPDNDLFHDGKDDGALRTIGEVAQALGLRQHVLRYWEDQFPMLRPLTRAGGRRYYRPEDIALVIEIDRLLHRDGYTVRGARQALAGGPSPRTVAVVEPVRETVTGHGDAETAAAEIEKPELALAAALAVLRQHLQSIRNRLAAELGPD